jgi:hypothetical protein
MIYLHHFLRFFVEVSRTWGSMFTTSCGLVVFCGDEVPLSTKWPRRVLLGNPYKIALPSFYFTAVTVRRGTTSVDGVQNFSAYFRYEFFSETELPVYGILGNSTWSTSYSRKPYM